MAGAKPARSCILAPNPCSMIQGAPVHAGIPVRAPQILERCSAHHQGQVLSHGSIAPVNLIPAQVVEVGISTFPVEVSSNSGCESWARNLSRPLNRWGDHQARAQVDILPLHQPLGPDGSQPQRPAQLRASGEILRVGLPPHKLHVAPLGSSAEVDAEHRVL